MNSQNAKEYLPLIKAMAEGRTIQCHRDEWEDQSELQFNLPPQFYRIKPNEPRRWWIVRWSESKHDIAFSEQGALSMLAQFPEKYAEIIPVEERLP